MRALADVGVTSASSEYVEFDGAAAIVVERYDRIRTADGRVLRLHQEDMCQALSVPPDRKYASDGGPSATAIAGLLAREAAQSDVDRFTDLVVAQYLLGAPDGHAKNYSVILDGLDVILAPAYDIASSLPYDPSRGSGLARIAMPIAGRSKFGEVTLRHIEKFAGAAGTDPDRLVARTREMAAALPDALAQVDPDATDDAMVALRADLVDAVAEHCATLDPTPTAPPTRGRSGDQP